MSETGITRSAASAGRYRSWAATHCGSVRTYNEDAYVNRPDLGLWAVADGAGGHQAGEVASALVVEALQGVPPGLTAGEILIEVRQRLNQTHIRLRAVGESRGPGAIVATTVVALMARDDHYACLWAGDSRAYLLRGGVLTPITRDHSLVQSLVETGAIAAADAAAHPHANVITRALGADLDVFELERCSGKLLPGDRLMLCSDGLCKTLSDVAITAVLAADEDAIAERLVLAALAAEVDDNVTAVTIEIIPLRKPAP